MKWNSDLRGRDADVYCINCAQMVKPKLEASAFTCAIMLGVGATLLAYVWVTYSGQPNFFDALGIAGFVLLVVGFAVAYYVNPVRSCPICKSRALEASEPSA